MGLFRRKEESLNERLLREGGLDPASMLGDTATPTEPEASPASDDPPPMFDGFLADLTATGNHDLEWDVAVTAHAPGVAGDEVDFKTLPNGDVIVEKEKGDGDLSPMADAIEKQLSPPYHAHAGRQRGDLWGVGAKRIEVAHFAFAAGDSLELAQNDGETELKVDGESSDAPAPVELARLGERSGTNYCVEASRIDGDFWDVKVSPL